MWKYDVENILIVGDFNVDSRYNVFSMYLKYSVDEILMVKFSPLSSLAHLVHLVTEKVMLVENDNIKHIKLSTPVERGWGKGRDIESINKLANDISIMFQIE